MFLVEKKTKSPTPYFALKAINEIFNTDASMDANFLTLSSLLSFFKHPSLLKNILSFAFLLFLLPGVSLSQNSDDLRQEVDRIIRYETDISFEKTPGFIIGILDGTRKYVLPYGSVTRDSVLAPDAHSVFGLGELSQVFIAHLFFQLDSAGLVDLSVGMNDFLPDSLKNPSAQTLTIHDFLVHTTGLPRLPFGIEKDSFGEWGFSSSYPLPSLASYLREFDFNQVEKGKYRYSSLAYAMLELFFYYNFSDGEKLEEYIKAWLFNPLGMNNTGFVSALSQQPVAGHNRAGEVINHPTGHAHYGISSTMQDLMRYLEATFQNTDTLERMLTKQIPTGIRKNTWSASGWHLIRRKNQLDIITHAGTTAGHRACIAFVPQTKTGVIILSNSPFDLDGLEFEILRMLNNNWKSSRKKK